MLKESPFHPRTSALMEGFAWRRWAGYTMASVYELTHEREYHAVRSSAALFDVTPLYKYLIGGRDATRLLDRIVTRDVAKSKIGQVLYTPWCDARGKVIDDGTVSRLDETTFRMTSADPSIRWLHLNASGLECTIEDISERTAALSLQGPLSRVILELASEQDLSALKYFRLTAAKIRGVPVTISRTGYTGDLGYEIWVDAPRALPVWDALIESGSGYGITPAGLLALDLVRNEAGLLLIDVDYISAHHALIESQMSTPYELSLGWTVALDKDRFNGRDALVAEKERGPAWRFMGVEVDWDALERLYADVGLPPKLPATAWRASVPLYMGGVQVGYATSGCWSPLLKRYIALAHLEGPYGEPDTVVEMEVTVEHRRKRAGATVRALPFFNPPRKRA
ncbi:MAG TPA: aminomethyltransferase family protein [Gemmatimonadales bacterium]|nr:aminomethyltransferase family protein [Gemmatimonadales bacterium]